MTPFTIVRKNLSKRALSTLLTIISVALGAALVIAVQVAEKETERSFNQTSVGFDLILAAPGSRMQATLNTIYHLETSTGIIPAGVFQALLNDPRVERVFPFYVGDSYRGYRVIGTTASFLKEAEPRAGSPFALSEGRIFENPFEVVIGSETAARLGLRLGDQVVFTHGVAEVAPGAEAHEHEDDPATVVGILSRTNTANDRVLFTSIFTTHALHHHLHDHDHDEHHKHDSHKHDAHGHTHDHSNHHSDGHHHTHDHHADHAHHEHSHEHTHDHDHDHDHDHHPSKPTLTELEATVTELDAVLVKFKNQALAISVAGMLNFPTPENPLLLRNLQRDPLFPYKDDLMGVIPAVQIKELMSIVGNAEQVIRAIALLVLITALLGVLASLYNTMDGRRRDIAIMRSLGARKTSIFLLITLEAAVITLVGCLFGLLVGHTIVHFASPVIAETAGIIVTGFIFESEQFFTLGLFILGGVIAGMIPAIKAYNTDVASNLAP